MHPTIRTLILASLAALCLLGLSGCAAGGGGTGVDADVVATSAGTFSPVTIYARPGDVIRWTNNDTDPHTVTADLTNQSPLGPNSDNLYGSGIPASGTFTWMVPHQTMKGVTFTYHCRFDGTTGTGTEVGTGMAGRVIVH
jgi:plastocyanin